MLMLMLEHFTTWMIEYGRAGAESDPRASVNLFVENAHYQERPFDESIRGRAALHEYRNEGVQRLMNRESAFEILSAEGNRGIAHRQSSFTVIE